MENENYETIPVIIDVDNVKYSVKPEEIAEIKDNTVILKDGRNIQVVSGHAIQMGMEYYASYTKRKSKC